MKKSQTLLKIRSGAKSFNLFQGCILNTLDARSSGRSVYLKKKRCRDATIVTPRAKFCTLLRDISAVYASILLKISYVVVIILVATVLKFQREQIRNEQVAA